MFLQGRHTDGLQTHQKMLNIRIIKRIQIKTALRCYLTLVITVIIKKKKDLQTINAGEGVKKREPSGTVGGNVNG